MKGFIRELRRRKVFRMAGFYIVGAWLVMQAADVFFPAWGLPDAALNILLIAAVVGFPLALVFGWFYDVTTHGVVRTPATDEGDVAGTVPLQRTDYLILAALAGIAVFIIFRAGTEIVETPRVDVELSPGPDTTDGASPEKLPNSIAVLPFDNIGTDPEDEMFAEGVSEEIRNRLGRHAELRVIARASSSQFGNSDYGATRVSDLLGVQYLLLGSVRRQGQRIRVSAQLVADKGIQVWSENYDRVLEDVFGIQDEIADLVAAEVAPQIVARPNESYRPSLDAYRHFLAGRDLIYRRDVWAAQRELAMAVELDPGYAEPQAEYAISLVIGYPGDAQLERAEAAIDAALDLAPDLPRAHAARGLFLNSKRPPDPVAAEAALREALRGDPNMVDAMNWLSGALELQGKNEESEEWTDKAYRIDPFNAAIASNLARRHWRAGEPDRAEAILRRMIELPEPPYVPFFVLWNLYTDTGRLVEANQIAKQLLLAGGWHAYFLAFNYAMLGRFEIADEWLSATARDNPDLMWVRIGWVQAQSPYLAGDHGQAAAEMRQAMSSHGILLNQLDSVPRLFYGINQALAGDHADAIATLAENLPDRVDRSVLDDFYGADAYQALAWAYVRSGLPEESLPPLAIVEEWFAERSASVVMMKSEDLYAAARNAVLMGNHDLALERLEQAVEAGWRDYYVQRHDPRWGPLQGDPRYRSLMAGVKADVDRQRAEVERIDAEEDFAAWLEQTRADRQRPDD
ncbi:MAG: hypothetical protein PVI25_01650 [Gammaproteobacteria bacterium]